MQGAAGAILAFLTCVVRDHFASRPPWHDSEGGWCRAEDPLPAPAPPPRDDVTCPESWVHPGIVEEIAQRLAADRCVCEVQCGSDGRDFALFAGGVAFFGVVQDFVHVLIFFGKFQCCRRDGARASTRTTPSGSPRGHRRASFGAGVIE